MAQVDKRAERQQLIKLISQWNIDHYDIFELSQPDETNLFHGVVRFFFQGGGANVVTKCIRVASDATTNEVIDVLVEKFRPDMRMLTQSKYALYEVHVNGEERQLRGEEHPLLVQLNWGKDVREGRFLLKREDEATRKGATGEWPEQEKAAQDQGFKRKLSKREKKEKKKREKEKNKENVDKGDTSVAEKLYTDLPETSFTRSISNPEAVMRRRRQQKLEKKLQQMQGGDSDSGGVLKIYGNTICPDVPYKTLLLSTNDQTTSVVREAMEKYGIEKEDPATYCLVQIVLPPGGVEYHGGQMGEERILGDDERPLLIVMQHPKHTGHVIFQLRRRPNNLIPGGQKRPQKALSHNDLRYQHDPKNINADDLPFLLEMDSRGGKPKRHLLPLNVTEVGSERSMSNSSQYLQLPGNDIKPRHCVIAHTEGIVTVTPTSRDAETYVEHTRIYETTMLKDGMTVQFGKSFVFRFCDPRFEEHRRHPEKGMQKPSHHGYNERPHETNFDVDGHVETINNGSSPRSPGRSPGQEWDMHRRSAPDLHQGPSDMTDSVDMLPASLEFRNNDESSMLREVIIDVNSRGVQFKLAPTYTLYMGSRHCLSPHIAPHMQPQQRAGRLAEYVNRISKMVQQAIQDHHNDPTALAFWMANASEILHFIKQDHDVQPFSHDAQELLAEAVQMAFHHLVRCLQVDLQRVMPAFLDPVDMEDEDDRRDPHYNSGKPTLTDVLNTLSAAMTLLRRCRVNAALTIQLFSQLFHFINMWLFNILVTEPQLQLYTRSWGIRLKRRLGRIEAWAEKQGLELAADCHLCRIIQAAHLLQAPKMTADDITNISSTCFKLNSLQLHTLLVRYLPEPREPPIANGFIEKVVGIAKNMADELTRTDGREVRLEEDQDLHLPFLLPEDGYSCDTIRGIPNGLPEFIRPLTNAGIAKLVPNMGSSGSWTVYMGDSGGRPMENTPPKGPPPQGSQTPNLPRQPEVMNVVFKKVKGSMGLSIVAAMGEGQRERGIYIKSVVPNGAAALDGRLQAGDQLLEVDGRSLVGLTQDRAAELMTQTGQTVTLRVAKQGAIYHGLATLLSQPSPTMGRAASQPQNNQNRPGQMNNRPNPNMEEGPPPYTESPRDPRMYNGMEGRGQPSPRLPPNQGMGRPQQMEQPHKDDRFRAPSVGNLGDARHHPNHMPYDPNMHRRDNEQDPRSKSTSNLHMDTSYERPDPGMMKPAASVAAMGPGPPGHSYQPNFGRKPNDYENQPQMNSLPNERGDPMKPGRGYTDINQNNMPVKPNHHHSQPHLHPQHRPNDRSSVSSRTSSSSNRDNRPQSAYYDTQNRDDFGSSRPKSDEITPNRIREWQEKIEDPQGQPFQNNQLQDHHSPHYNQGGPARDINDSRNHQDIPKISINNAPRQPNFYENTVQSQEAAPPFHQLPKQNDEKPKPRVKPKPPVKPAQQRVQPAEVPFTQVDHRQSQPQFFEPKSSPQEPVNLYNPHANKQFQQPRKDPRASFGKQKKFSPDRPTAPYGYRDQEDMPPPPQDDIAPELPPPPANDDLHENSPPLPPPPSHDYMMEQQLQDEQRRLMNQIGQAGNFNSDPRYGGPAGYNRNEYEGAPGQYQDRTRPGQGYSDRQYPNNQQSNIHPNYQNISFGGPETQPPPIPQPPEHNVYEQYEAQRQDNMQPPQQQPGAMHLTVKEKEYNVGASPWNREEKEKAQEKYEEDMSRLREMEISELESKQYLNPQEQDRLRKLRLEAEFQRRVKETLDKEDDEDSDSEMAERLYSRDRMIQAMKEDLEKSRNRLIDLERKRLIDEFESEKERLIRLERRLDQFEKDREDHKLRIQKRQEKRQREHEEQQKRQREMRENQRQRFEDQKRLMMQEEEKMRQRREEELAKRKIYEREQLQQMQAARDAEEAAIRAQIRQQEEEYSRKRLERQRQERLEQQREIRVSEEKRRIDSMQQQNPNQGYDHQPYANLPPAQPERDVPQPPERNSSFNMLQRNSKRNSDYQPAFREQQQPQKAPTTMRPGLENPAPKKSVSFNTQLETRNTYSVGSMSGSESHPSVSSYRSSQGSQSEPADNHHYMDHQGMPPESNEVFMSPPQNSNTVDVKYVAGNTPNVVGAQEIYRDPRMRIEAQKAANSIKRPGAERMSFRDKMKYFATEAGEDTIKLKAKASKSQRTIESQLNGQ